MLALSAPQWQYAGVFNLIQGSHLVATKTRFNAQTTDACPTMTETRAIHPLQHDPSGRRLSYTEAGLPDDSSVFICLPGLLETQDVFAPLLALANEKQHCRIITVDYCGRGESDPLAHNQHYAMSIYLEDLEEFIWDRIKAQVNRQDTAIYLVGTSMGGILAMHLLQTLKFRVKGLILNDIGLSLSWWSILGLYKAIDLKEFKRQLSLKPKAQRIDPRAIDDVGSKHHFDLEYDYDWTGMQFERLLKTFEGQVLLIHNNHSPICPRALALQFKASLPNAQLLSLNANTHPAAWSTEVCAWVGETLRLRPKNREATVANIIAVHAHASSSTIAPLESSPPESTLGERKDSLIISNTGNGAKTSKHDTAVSSTAHIENQGKHALAANRIDDNTHENTHENTHANSQEHTHENTRDHSHENVHESSHASCALPTPKADTAKFDVAQHQSLINPPVPTPNTLDVSPAPASTQHSQASHAPSQAAPSESQHPVASKQRGSLSTGATPTAQAPLSPHESLTKRILDHLKTLLKV